MQNPSLQRRWIQTAGLPPTFEHQLVRDELDKITKVAVSESTSRVVLYVGDTVIGALDLIPAVKDRINAKLAAANSQGAQPAREPQPGDTIIREFDPKNPAHRAALEQPQVIYDQAQEAPPIDLPDYIPPERSSRGDFSGRDIGKVILDQVGEEAGRRGIKAAAKFVGRIIGKIF